MSSIDDVVERNSRRGAAPRRRPGAPSLRLAVVACMDARLDVAEVLGLAPGEAHVLRNAGGAVTDDTLRSLLVSQRLLGTEHVMLVHHTGCGMLGLDDAAFAEAVAHDTGERPAFAAGGFADLDDDVRRSVERVAASRLLRGQGEVRGFVCDTETGALREVPPSTRRSPEGPTATSSS